MAKKAKERRGTAVGRDLATLHRFALELLRQHGLRDWSVYWAMYVEGADGGGVTLAHSKRIVLSAAYLSLLTKEQRRDAVRHEVAHAIVGVGVGHSDVWSDKFVQIGGTGEVALNVPWELYPWWGLCPNDHPFVSISPPGQPGFQCEHPEHAEPVEVTRYKCNTHSHVTDRGVGMMVATYPEPESTPTFAVGDVVRVIPYGSSEFDGAHLVIVEILSRDYVTRHLGTGDKVTVAHEGVEYAPHEGDSNSPRTNG